MQLQLHIKSSLGTGELPVSERIEFKIWQIEKFGSRNCPRLVIVQFLENGDHSFNFSVGEIEHHFHALLHFHIFNALKYINRASVNLESLN